MKGHSWELGHVSAAPLPALDMYCVSWIMADSKDKGSQAGRLAPVDVACDWQSNSKGRETVLSPISIGLSPPSVFHFSQSHTKGRALGDTVNFIPEEIHVLATRLATYISSDSTTAKVTNR